MANNRVLGYRLKSEPEPTDIKPCVRCGYKRRVTGGGSRSGLCKDCSTGMTPEEREQWRK